MRIKIGDMYEIVTPNGLAYFHYVYRQKEYGPMLRVLCGIHDRRPTDFEKLAASELQFITFFPLQPALNQGLVTRIGNVPPSEEAKAFPIFRSGARDPVTRKFEVWWLWDEEHEWRVSELTEEQKRYPISGVINDTLLIERIVSGWRAESMV